MQKRRKCTSCRVRCFPSFRLSRISHIWHYTCGFPLPCADPHRSYRRCGRSSWQASYFLQQFLTSPGVTLGQKSEWFFPRTPPRTEQQPRLVPPGRPEGKTRAQFCRGQAVLALRAVTGPKTWLTATLEGWNSGRRVPVARFSFSGIHTSSCQTLGNFDLGVSTGAIPRQHVGDLQAACRREYCRREGMWGADWTGRVCDPIAQSFCRRLTCSGLLPCLQAPWSRETVLASLAELLNVVAALLDEGVIVAQQVWPSEGCGRAATPQGFWVKSLPYLNKGRNKVSNYSKQSKSALRRGHWLPQQGEEEKCVAGSKSGDYKRAPVRLLGCWESHIPHSTSATRVGGLSQHRPHLFLQGSGFYSYHCQDLDPQQPR